MEKKLNRKEFFKEGAKYAAGVSAGLMGIQLLGTKEALADTKYTWPLPYTPLDPEAVRILGHDSFWSGYACAYGAFNAIIEALRNAIGAPYTELPTEIMIYGHGGGVGWGTLCGALNGSSAAISLVCTKPDTDILVNELIGWYTQTLFPSDISNQYAVNHTFTVNNYDQVLPQNESGSPLCHVSVTEWCQHANHKVHDLERKERCARLAGDVAAYAVQILNDHYNGQFTPTYVPPASIATCLACHGENMLDNVGAKMECMQCHGDPHQTAIGDTPEPIPAHFTVKQNYPNPFNPSTTIEFTLPRSQPVTLEIFNLNGQHIKTLINHRGLSAGDHRIQWDGKDQFGKPVSSGMYYYRVKAGKFNQTKTMMLVR